MATRLEELQEELRKFIAVRKRMKDKGDKFLADWCQYHIDKLQKQINELSAPAKTG